MCGIFGSYDFKTYEKLYNNNKERGNFAYGSVYIRPTNNPGYIKDVYCRKRPGTVNLTGDFAFQQDYDLFLGHTQAPTSVSRDFKPYTSHPFNSIHYIVAHNGVLENHLELVDEYIGSHDNPVDSSVIPVMLSYMIEFGDIFDDDNKQPELAAIEQTFSMIKGTFACWVYSKMTGDVYLVRSGSTLYGNVTDGHFSSVPVPRLCDQELDEGCVYCVTSEGLTTCGQFETNNPFFI